MDKIVRTRAEFHVAVVKRSVELGAVVARKAKMGAYLGPKHTREDNRLPSTLKSACRCVTERNDVVNPIRN